MNDPMTVSVRMSFENEANGEIVTVTRRIAVPRLTVQNPATATIVENECRLAWRTLRREIPKP